MFNCKIDWSILNVQEKYGENWNVDALQNLLEKDEFQLCPFSLTEAWKKKCLLKIGGANFLHSSGQATLQYMCLPATQWLCSDYSISILVLIYLFKY